MCFGQNSAAVRRAELGFQLPNLVECLIFWETSFADHTLKLIKSAELYYLPSPGHVTDVNGSYYTDSLWEEDLG